ncbi:MAG: SRPBCC family protein [Betaproteobacteria bacterium]|nr:SRPBCC family protein [Betaproteobacteria bacterium]
MKKLLTALLFGLSFLSVSARAEGVLNAYQTVDIKAPIGKVWDAVKDFDGLHRWHPVFSNDVIKSGRNNVVGAIRTLTIKDGPSFDETLLAWDAGKRRYTYDVIDPNPLPIKNYVCTMEVVQLRAGVASVIWTSSFMNNSDAKMKNEEVINFLNGAYKAGLDALKASLEK